MFYRECRCSGFSSCVAYRNYLGQLYCADCECICVSVALLQWCLVMNNIEHQFSRNPHQQDSNSTLYGTTPLMYGQSSLSLRLSKLIPFRLYISLKMFYESLSFTKYLGNLSCKNLKYCSWFLQHSIHRDTIHKRHSWLTCRLNHLVGCGCNNLSCMCGVF